MKKALLMKHKKHYLDIELEKAFSHGLNMAGFETTLVDMDELSNTLDNYKIEEYDMIAFDVLYNSQFLSGRKRAYLFEELAKRAKKGALTMYVCDIKLPLQVYLWDISHDVDRRNVFRLAPIKVIASLDPAIIHDKKAYDYIYNKWMKNLHEDSTIHFIEWITFAHETYGKNIDTNQSVNDTIRNFYYGMRRSYIARSLVSMGINSKEDLVYGSISKVIRNEKVRKIYNHVKTPFSWIPYVNSAESVFIPYEPIKSDYQITVRLLEAKRFYKDKVVLDDKINDEFIQYTQSPKPWIEKANQSARLIKDLYD